MKNKPKEEVIADMQQDRQEFLSLGSLLRPLTPIETMELVDFQLRRTSASQTPVLEGEVIFADKKLIRMVAGHQLIYSFVGNKKRYNLFKHLLESREYSTSEVLQNALQCPTPEALRKLVGSLNKGVAIKLQMKNPLIESQRGFGYRLSKNISINRA